MKSHGDLQSKVAIIGGALGGLVAARHLQSQDFTIFGQSDKVGEQWNRAALHSGV